MTRRIGSRFRALIGADPASLRQGLAALLVSSGGDLLAGLTLGAITGTLADLPGLLVLVPAAIGMRGNVFGALGSRFGTSIHAGTFTLSRRAETVVGQNVIAAMALSLSISFALAVLAKAVAIGFGLPHTISIAYFIVISIVGGAISSVFVLLLTIGVAAGSVRYGWDMDNVAAPLVTAAGDMVTLPSLFVATFIVGPGIVTPIIAAITGFVAVAALVAAFRSGLAIALRILRESVPILLIAGLIDVVAGLTIEKRLNSFLAFPALLVLVPPFLEDTGALGGILSARLASKLHLGTIEPTNVPPRVARDDFALTFVFAVPVFTLVAISSDVAANVAGLASPGVVKMVLISLIGGFMATIIAIGIVYYGAIATYRLGLDPDNHGIPLITSSMDLVGAFALILAIVLVGVH
ncbi:MAG: magnesium transporter [Acidimicrobiia bacterium]|nr:magnesium transporter [Acidimicrobiia bacterium]MBV9039390.1 magnesium transporter [Acidimicrobiia bacterium]